MSYTPGRTDGRENQSQIERERGRGVTTTTHNTHIYEENTQKGQVSYPRKKEKKNVQRKSTFSVREEQEQQQQQPGINKSTPDVFCFLASSSAPYL
jgi:hypothetical protein